MDFKEKIFPFVQRPGRYLGTEVNSIKKTIGTGLRIALAFPDLYEIGTSHFGIQILYNILNNEPDIIAERVYAPDNDMEARLEKNDLDLFALESGHSLNKFDWLGFSLLYELNYTNILTILHLAKIPFYSRDRDLSYPLIVGGGPCSCNPEPVADFFDAILIGDGEKAVLAMARAWEKWKAGKKQEKKQLLAAWADIEGVYAPSFFSESGPDGICAKPGKPDKVRRAIVPDLDKALFPTSPIIPYSRPVHDRLRLEVARGCGRGCRFCQAGMIYRPVRERSAENLCSLARDSIKATGYDDLSLLSLSVGDYSQIDWLMERFMGEFGKKNVSVSFPSVRAGTLTKALMEQIKKVRKTGFTIAPEAGSQRLRDVINKNISEDEIIQTVSDAFFMGWKRIKLYFMIGLPTETQKDIEAIVDLVLKLKKLAGRKADIAVSIGVFVPKPHTPFQWARQISVKEALLRQNYIRDHLRRPGIKLKAHNPKVSIVEGVFSRGNRALCRVLVKAWEEGARFDGWSEHFDFDLWMRALEGTDLDQYLDASPDTSAPMAWDHIDMRIDKDFLKSEWELALKGEITQACAQDSCPGCGVCDFAEIFPRFSPKPAQSSEPPENRPWEKEAVYKKLLVYYSKTGTARYLGHLELAGQVLKALRRAGIPMLYSKGFHPKPKVSFDQALPVGMESQEENFVVSVKSDVLPQQVCIGLNNQLPEGLEVTECVAFSKEKRGAGQAKTAYEVSLDPKHKKGIKKFCQADSFVVTHTTHKGAQKKLNLAELVDIQLGQDHKIIMTVENQPGKSIRPLEILGHILGVALKELAWCGVLKLSARKSQGQLGGKME